MEFYVRVCFRCGTIQSDSEKTIKEESYASNKTIADIFYENKTDQEIERNDMAESKPCSCGGVMERIDMTESGFATLEKSIIKKFAEQGVEVDDFEAAWHARRMIYEQIIEPSGRADKNCEDFKDNYKRWYEPAGERTRKNKEFDALREARTKAVLDAQQQQFNEMRNAQHPVCPTCKSRNTEKISATSKAFGAIAFGLFSTTARSQFRCKNCGYKW